MAKWWCTQKQCDIVDECLQLHGGYGYIWEYPIARMYADYRVQKKLWWDQRNHEGIDFSLPLIVSIENGK